MKMQTYISPVYTSDKQSMDSLMIELEILNLGNFVIGGKK